MARIILAQSVDLRPFLPTSCLLTVADFRNLPEDSGPVYHELRHGEVVAVTRPELKHALLQRRLRHLLEEIADPTSLIDTEVAFRPLPEYELWVADIAYLSPERFAAVDLEENVLGAPDLVIGVLSPSNTVNEMNERERICLENGAREFWVMDQTRRQVKVSTPDGHTITYRSGQEIPLLLAGGDQTCSRCDFQFSAWRRSSRSRRQGRERLPITIRHC